MRCVLLARRGRRGSGFGVRLAGLQVISGVVGCGASVFVVVVVCVCVCVCAKGGRGRLRGRTGPLPALPPRGCAHGSAPLPAAAPWSTQIRQFVGRRRRGRGPARAVQLGRGQPPPARRRRRRRRRVRRRERRRARRPRSGVVVVLGGVRAVQPVGVAVRAGVWVGCATALAPRLALTVSRRCARARALPCSPPSYRGRESKRQRRDDGDADGGGGAAVAAAPYRGSAGQRCVRTSPCGRSRACHGAHTALPRAPATSHCRG
jgi:hypothetical protein